MTEGTKEDPWKLTAPGSSNYEMYVAGDEAEVTHAPPNNSVRAIAA